MFNIHLGVPEMEVFWANLKAKHNDGTSSKNEEKLYKQIGKAMYLIANNPRHTGLHTHEIDALTSRYGMKVWQSYLENNTPNAGRIFLVYGPNHGDITIIGVEPHPEDKTHAYKTIPLSHMGKEL